MIKDELIENESELYNSVVTSVLKRIEMRFVLINILFLMSNNLLRKTKVSTH